MILWFHRRRQIIRNRGVAVALVAAIVWIGGLSHAPAAHTAVHDHAGEADHHCVVEIFADGILLGDLNVAVSAPSELLVITNSVLPLAVYASDDWLTPPGRAPPLG